MGSIDSTSLLPLSPATPEWGNGGHPIALPIDRQRSRQPRFASYTLYLEAFRCPARARGAPGMPPMKRRSRPVRSMPANSQRLLVPVRRRERLRRMLVLSLGLHLEILALCLFFLPELPAVPEPEQGPLGKGSPTSVAMMMDLGTAEGVKLPTPSYAPAKVAPGEAPSMAPPPPMPQPAPAAASTAETAPVVSPPVPAPQAAAPPPERTPTVAPTPSPLPAFTTDAEADPLPPRASTPAPPPPIPPPPAPAQPSHAAAQPARRPAPQTMTRNTLPVPPSHTMKQPNRTANNQGMSSDAPGPQAVNSEGAPAHSTNGADPTTSTGGAAGEDGQPDLLHRHLAQRATDTWCTGIYNFSPTANGSHEEGPGAGEHFFPEMPVPVQAHFFRKPDGTRWVTFNFRARVPADLPVTVMGSGISWIGQYDCHYTVWPSGGNHLTGRCEGHGKIDLACDGGLPSL